MTLIINFSFYTFSFLLYFLISPNQSFFVLTGRPVLSLLPSNNLAGDNPLPRGAGYASLDFFNYFNGCFHKTIALCKSWTWCSMFKSPLLREYHKLWCKQQPKMCVIITEDCIRCPITCKYQHQVHYYRYLLQIFHHCYFRVPWIVVSN